MIVPAHVAVIDFEACGIGPGMWPVEAGWMRADWDEPRSMLVKPHASWDLDLWQPAAENIHGLSLIECANRGRSVEEVADALRADLETRLIVSDGRTVDQFWSDRLWIAAGHTRRAFEIAPLGEALRAAAAASDLDSDLVIRRFQFDNVRAAPAPHRAGPDAARVLAVIRAALASAQSNPPVAHAPWPRRTP